LALFLNCGLQAIRQNGQILGTDYSRGVIHLVDPQYPQANPPVIAQFPNGTSALGITEVQDDIFYTLTLDDAGSPYTFTYKPNSTAVWEVDMRSFGTTGDAKVRKVVDMPAVWTPNGMTTLSKKDSTLLIADSAAGVVWKLNICSGAYEIVFDDPLLKPIATKFPSFGVNGLKIASKPNSKFTLYFSNTNHGYLGTVPISLETGKPTGPAAILAANVSNADDFAIDRCGNIWLCENVSNTLVRVFPDGHVQTIAGGQNQTALIGPVAASFGKGWDDKDVLYISTDGLTLDPTTSKPLTTNGKIAAIDTRAIW
jgi:sugar lactone lactonase YvrE